MFDWDDVPEDLGGANRGTIEATARAARAEIEKNFEDLRQTELSAAQIEIHEPVQELGIHADMSIENRHPKAESTHSKTSWMDQLQGHASNEGNNIQKKADKPKAKKAVKKAAAVSKEVQLAEKSGANDLQGVLKLLQQGARTNATDPAGETPLFRAAAGGNIDIVAAFLIHGADPCRRSSAGWVAGDVAANATTKVLLDLFGGVYVDDQEAEAALNAVGDDMRPAMKMELAERNAARMMEEEMKNRAQGKYLPPTLPAAPAFAPTAAPRPTAEQAALTVTASSETPLARAVGTGKVRDVIRELRDGADPNAGDDLGETPLFEAAVTGDADVVAALLVHRADPSKRSHSGMLPETMSNSGAVRGLLGFFNGQDLGDEAREFVLESLSEVVRPTVERELQERFPNKVEVFVRKETRQDLPRPSDIANLSQQPLAAAARTADLEEVLRLLEDGADPNCIDELGETPLFEAASSGNADVTAALLLHGADPKLKSFIGTTAVNLADDPYIISLFHLFSGVHLELQVKHHIMQALTHEEIKAKIAVRLRSSGMDEALKHTLRKLRGQ